MQAGDEARSRRIANGIAIAHTRDLMRAGFSSSASRSMPSEPALMERFGASRSTVRRALGLLAESGVVERTRGVGTALRPALPSLELVDFHGAAASAERSGWLRELTTEILAWDVIAVTPELAASLTTDVGADCLRVDTLSWWRGTPYSAGTYYTRHPEFTLLRRDGLRSDWYSFVRAAGIDVATTTVGFQASVADSLDADFLQIDVGAALMLVDSRSVTVDDAVFDLAFVRRRGDNTRVVTRMDRRAN